MQMYDEYIQKWILTLSQVRSLYRKRNIYETMAVCWLSENQKFFLITSIKEIELHYKEKKCQPWDVILFKHMIMEQTVSQENNHLAGEGEEIIILKYIIRYNGFITQTLFH